MPIYEYLCNACGHEFEEVQKFNDPTMEECPDCGKNSAERQVSMSSFHLKGGGWYKDGYSSSSTESKNTEKSAKGEPPSSGSNTSAKEKSSGKSGETQKKDGVASKTPKTSKKDKAA
ncbi:MAG: zinc ribbon domain-containing protein [SAR324 cluster bacterium]|nr:zinc ribbon domain-containing protein [SAR324 cluster bacterium]MBL7034924.1 zinc ribbon domain-containing protein [SAR324 cluster bacterium]